MDQTSDEVTKRSSEPEVQGPAEEGLGAGYAEHAAPGSPQSRAAVADEVPAKPKVGTIVDAAPLASALSVAPSAAPLASALSVTPSAAPLASALSVAPSAAPLASALSVAPSAAPLASALSVAPSAAPLASALSVAPSAAPLASALSVAPSAAPSVAPTQVPSKSPVLVPSLTLKAAAKRSSNTLKAGASISLRPSAASVLRGGAGGQRYRSVMSMASRGSVASSIASRVSRGSPAPDDFGLSPGLQQLIARIVDTKDVGLVAYLSAVAGEPLAGGRPTAPPPTEKLQRKHSSKPKSIMKISKPQVRFEPTYRLDPVRPFGYDRAVALVQSTLQAGLGDTAYSDEWAIDACRILAAYITQSIKVLDSPRYKIATVVTVMERRAQGVRTELRTLWDAERDHYCSASAENNSMIASAVVLAVYWD